LLCSPYRLCRHFGLLFGERLDMLFTSSDKKISGFTRPHDIGFVADLFFSTLAPSTRYRIRCAEIYFFPLWGADLFFFRIRCRIRRIRVDGSRIRNEKVADSKISGYMWTEPKKNDSGFVFQYKPPIFAVFKTTKTKKRIRIFHTRV